MHIKAEIAYNQNNQLSHFILSYVCLLAKSNIGFNLGYQMRSENWVLLDEQILPNCLMSLDFQTLLDYQILSDISGLSENILIIDQIFLFHDKYFWEANDHRVHAASLSDVDDGQGDRGDMGKHPHLQSFEFCEHSQLSWKSSDFLTKLVIGVT